MLQLPVPVLLAVARPRSQSGLAAASVVVQCRSGYTYFCVQRPSLDSSFSGLRYDASSELRTLAQSPYQSAASRGHCWWILPTLRIGVGAPHQQCSRVTTKIHTSVHIQSPGFPPGGAGSPGLYPGLGAPHKWHAVRYLSTGRRKTSVMIRR